MRRKPAQHESIFYFNFQQIPPYNFGCDTATGQYKILVALRKRVKLFFTPTFLPLPTW
ncbi:MAG: fimbria/pilus periplasmic chaperone [Candidatus Malihini olakiniferum]